MTITDEDGKHTHAGTFNYNNSILCYEFREPFNNGSMSGDNIWRLDRLLPYSVVLKVIGNMYEKEKELEF